MKPHIYTVMSLIVSLLFYEDGFGIREPTNVDMPSKKSKQNY